MRMKTKITAGFSIITTLLFIMGVVSLIQINSASTGFSEYRNLARDTNLAGRLQANMLMVRMNVKDFLITGSEKDFEQYSEYRKKMNEFLKEAQIEIQNKDRASLIDKTDISVHDYENAFEQVYKFRAERDNAVYNYLNVQGPLMEKTLTEILISAENDNDMTASYYSALAMKHLLLGRLYMAKFLETNNSSSVERVYEEFGKMEETLIILDKELQNKQRRQYLAVVNEAKDIYLTKFKELVTIIISRNLIISEQLDVNGPLITSWVEEVKLSVKADQDELGPKLQRSNSRANIIIWIILTTALLSAILIAVYTIKSTIKQLGSDPSELMVISEKIANGDLTIDESKESNKIIGVHSSMIMMQEKLSEIVKQVLEGTAHIAAASSELATGNMDLAGRTEQQAAALEQTSAAIEEMNSSIRSNANNTKTANDLADVAMKKTEEGNLSVSDMISSMKEISESSNRIGKIIEVINNIAFQTNLLALNASIEAARAGEQGKGFAVVAVEVRKLAKKSDKAASEIAEIIKLSSINIEKGEKIANRAGTILKETNKAVKEVSSLVGEISSTSKEQLSSVNQIDITLSSLDENTQKNASLVEEATAATEELSSKAEELNDQMKFFKLDNVAENSRQNNIIETDFNNETYIEF